ncbi:Copper transport protein 86 [Neolecta irregularis DAH-3]|uniref:Ataxin-10 homolog n=1 Tax=Neolecta irregularis (strain DAH-3) TaxID=1198029 RepID=A0A1U7LW15_NEOID|nr:Copper transport protein 86 [Neolecta irregularis DAH-3]|eukprot:OLL26763.1 Copper transport protein 86 [Neolecta irregularis DAH-3]
MDSPASFLACFDENNLLVGNQGAGNTLKELAAQIAASPEERITLALKPSVWVFLYNIMRNVIQMLDNDAAVGLASSILRSARTLLAAGITAQALASQVEFDILLESNVLLIKPHEKLLCLMFQFLSNSITSNIEMTEKLLHRWTLPETDILTVLAGRENHTELGEAMAILTLNMISQSKSICIEFTESSTGPKLLQYLLSFDTNVTENRVLADVMANIVIRLIECRVLLAIFQKFSRVDGICIEQDNIIYIIDTAFTEDVISVYSTCGAIIAKDILDIARIIFKQTECYMQQAAEILPDSCLFPSALSLLDLLFRLSVEESVRIIMPSEEILEIVISMLKNADQIDAVQEPRRRSAGKPNSRSAFIKRDCLRLVASLSFESRTIQDRVFNMGVLPLILSQCHIDDNNPYLREYAIFCIRNLLKNNTTNQAAVESLEALRTVPSVTLERAGFEAFIDVDSKVKLRQKVL